mgnify:CR=1 FL=1
MKKVSIIDVAKLAGVSVSTVSLVLRQKGKISDATIEKVNAAIQELGYVHNVAAANLRANTTNLIGLILRDFNDSFSIKVMANIVQELEKQGYMVMPIPPAMRCLRRYKHVLCRWSPSRKRRSPAIMTRWSAIIARPPVSPPAI